MFDRRPPEARTVTSRSTSISRSLRGAKSAWPPSPGDGMYRPSTRWSKRLAQSRAGGDDRDVAVAAELAVLQGVQFVAVQQPARHAPSLPRSFKSDTRRMPRTTRRSASASTRHGTLVRCRRCPITGPATPKHAASIELPAPTALSEVLDHRDETREVERRVLARRHRQGAAADRLEQSEQRLGAADVACEKHGIEYQITQLPD